MLHTKLASSLVNFRVHYKIVGLFFMSVWYTLWHIVSNVHATCVRILLCPSSLWLQWIAILRQDYCNAIVMVGGHLGSTLTRRQTTGARKCPARLRVRIKC